MRRRSASRRNRHRHLDKRPVDRSHFIAGNGARLVFCLEQRRRRQAGVRGDGKTGDSVRIFTSLISAPSVGMRKIRARRRAIISADARHGACFPPKAVGKMLNHPMCSAKRRAGACLVWYELVVVWKARQRHILLGVVEVFRPRRRAVERLRARSVGVREEPTAGVVVRLR